MRQLESHARVLAHARGERRREAPRTPASLSAVADAVSTLADGARITCFDGHVWQLEQPLTPEIPLHLHLVVGEYAVLIDTGLASTYPLIGQFLDAAGVRPADVRIIFNTHAHHDHIGSNRRVQQDTDALIAAASGAAPWIEDHARQLRQFAFHHPDIYPGTPEERAEIEGTLDGEVRVDILLEEPTQFNLGRGVGIQVLSVPGHVEAEMAYYERSSGSLILGDAITGTDWSFFHGHMQRSAFLSTIARMRAFAVNNRVERALLAHYEVMDRQQFLSLLDRVEAYVTRIDQTIIDIVRGASDCVDLETVWRTVCERMNKQLEFRGLLTVDGHLRELAAGGVFERVRPDCYTWVGA
jgi:glyoxylase-like metal-dependent hydrolase (beta-lactamase superfamily II)